MFYINVGHTVATVTSSTGLWIDKPMDYLRLFDG